MYNALGAHGGVGVASVSLFATQIGFDYGRGPAVLSGDKAHPSDDGAEHGGEEEERKEDKRKQQQHQGSTEDTDEDADEEDGAKVPQKSSEDRAAAGGRRSKFGRPADLSLVGNVTVLFGV